MLNVQFAASPALSRPAPRISEPPVQVPTCVRVPRPLVWMWIHGRLDRIVRQFRVRVAAIRIHGQRRRFPEQFAEQFPEQLPEQFPEYLPGLPGQQPGLPEQPLELLLGLRFKPPLCRRFRKRGEQNIFVHVRVVCFPMVLTAFDHGSRASWNDRRSRHLPPLVFCHKATTKKYQQTNQSFPRGTTTVHIVGQRVTVPTRGLHSHYERPVLPPSEKYIKNINRAASSLIAIILCSPTFTSL